MNVCAVLMIRTLVGLMSQPSFAAVRYAFEKAPLPHEPKSEHRYALVGIPITVNFEDATTKAPLAICKHCGSIYPEES